MTDKTPGLFEQKQEDAQPLARRMRPRTFDDIAGQEHIFSGSSGMRRIVESRTFFSFILYGPPGTGKTASAYLIAEARDAEVEVINAVTSNIGELKNALKAAEERLKFENKRTVLFIDELHRFNKLQQDALLPAVENGVVSLLGVTTQNPAFYINDALLSRCHRLPFKALEETHIASIIRGALQAEHGLGEYDLEIEDEAMELLIRNANGDGRRALSVLEMAALSVLEGSTIEKVHVSSCLIGQHSNYDRDGDAHYDVASAFIKSMRGSDPDAVLYYLARMLEAGEDPRFICRRIMIAASEDVGIADSGALQLAAAAARAVEQVGMPEARIIIAHAALRVAVAPKSNAVCKGIDAALSDIRSNTILPVPDHLKDAHYKDARRQGIGQAYLYPHDYPDHYVDQPYLAENRHFYEPAFSGREKDYRRWLEYLRSRDRENG